MKENIKLYSVKDICNRYGITRKTLFYYDKVGLLKPVERKGKQLFKFYDDACLERLGKIRIFREAGLSIDTIKKIIDNNNHDNVRSCLMEELKYKEENLKASQEEIVKLKHLISLYGLSGGNVINNLTVPQGTKIE